MSRLQINSNPISSIRFSPKCLFKKSFKMSILIAKTGALESPLLSLLHNLNSPWNSSEKTISKQTCYITRASSISKHQY